MNQSSRAHKKMTRRGVPILAVLLVYSLGVVASVSAQTVVFTRLNLKRLLIGQSSQLFNVSDDFVVFQNLGPRAEGQFANAYDLTKSRLVTDKIKRSGVHHGLPYEQFLPDVSGTVMSYLAYRIDIGGWDVYVYDYALREERRLTTTPSVQELLPAISGDRVVWADNRDGQYRIYLFNLTTGQEQRVTSLPKKPLELDFDGDHIVWTDARYDAWGNGQDTDVFLFTLSLNREERISQGPAATTAHSPALSGGWLAWADGRNNPSGSLGATNIFVKELATGRQWQVTNGPHETRCSISGQYVVYEDRNALRAFDWVLHDLTSGQETGLLPKSDWPVTMKIGGRYIAYVDLRALAGNGAFFLGTVP